MADLCGLKEGDLIAVREYINYWSGPSVDYELKKIDKVTKSQLVCGGSRYRISDGRKIGGRYSEAAEIATDEIITKHKKQIAARKKFVSVKNLAEKLYEAAKSNSLSETEQDQLLAMFKDKNWS